jgi:hypothetical protein
MGYFEEYKTDYVKRLTSTLIKTTLGYDCVNAKQHSVLLLCWSVVL